MKNIYMEKENNEREGKGGHRNWQEMKKDEEEGKER